MWRKLWRFLSPFHRTFALFVVLMVAYALMEVAGSYMPSLVIQLHEGGADTSIWVLVILGKYVFDDMYMRLDNAVDWHVVTKHSLPIYRYVKTTVMEKLLQLDVGWHHSRDSGAVLSRVNYGTEKIEELLNSLSWEFVPRTIQGLMSMIPLAWFSPLSVVVVIGSTVVFMRLTLRSNEVRREIKSQRYDLYDDLGSQEVEAIQNIATVIEHRQIGRLLGEYRATHDEQESLARRDFWINNYRYNRLRIWTLNLARSVVVCLWVYQLTHEMLTVPQLVFVWGLTDKLFESCWKYVTLLDKVFDAREPVGRVLALREEPPTVLRTGTTTQASRPLDVVIGNVCFSYSGDYDPDEGTIHNLNLVVPEGSTVGLVGRSGSGKTTLYQLMMGMRHPQSGVLLIGGVDVRDWDHDSLLSHLGHMASGDLISSFSDTIEKNIAFGKPSASHEEVVRTAKLAGLHDFIVSLPLGYDTPVGERGVRLSAGQKQRMEFARALLLNPKILLLDEPTSAVDSQTEEIMQGAIRSLHGQCTMFISAHRLATTMHADKIVVLEGGRKIEEGRHNELLALGGRYAKMWAMQTGRGVN